MAGQLTPKQRRFVAEYLVDLNATQAAIRAGYSAKTARQQAAGLLTKPNISAAVGEQAQRQAAKLDLTAEYVLTGLKVEAERAKNPAAVRVRALELLGKHLALFADRHEVTGPGGGPIEVTKIERVIVDRSEGEP